MKRAAQWVKAVGKRIFTDIRQYYMAAVIFAVYYLVSHLLYQAYCPMIVLTGFPCAGCGMTRAVFYAVTGQFARSISMNPLGIPIALALLYCGICRYLVGTRVKGFMVILVVGVMALLLCYVWRMYLYFPNRVPYVYTSHNILAEHMPYYKTFVNSLLTMLK